MRPPAFAPPYDSPIEEEFARVATKDLSPDVDFIPQYEVHTLCGRFVIDFVVTDGKRRVGFECDGREFHNASDDEWRDAMILGDDKIDAMYRLRGTDIYRRIEDCLHLISRREPWMFSSRGLRNLRTLATPKLREHEWVEEEIIVRWDTDSDGQPRSYPEVVALIARDRVALTDTSRRYFWVNAYRWVRSHGGGPLDEVREAWRAAMAER